jgi:hypothetical protein
MKQGAVTIIGVTGGCLGLALAANPLPVFGCDRAAASRRVNVEVGNTAVSAIGRSAKASTNIGGLDDGGTSGDGGSCGRVRVRCGPIERIAVGENASATVALPGDTAECREE